MSKILISNHSLNIHNSVQKAQNRQAQEAKNTPFVNKSNFSLPAYSLRAQFATAYKTGAISFKSNPNSSIDAELEQAVASYGNTGIDQIRDLLSQQRGNIFIVSGPTGSGKGTLLNMLQKTNEPQITYTKTATTRQVTSDAPDAKYTQVTKEEFLDLLQNRELLECTSRYGNYYGTYLNTVKEDLENGKNIVFEIDVTGALKIKENLPEAKLIFVAPESLEHERKQLIGRGRESIEKIEERLKSIQEELDQQDKFDYVIVNKHGKVEEAFEELKKFILE